jgi:7-carboxy-7-deazaguanine synthase
MSQTESAPPPADERLRITEIFHSIQGESRSIGLPTVFVRLTGCPLRCGYCDTSYAFSGGHWMDLGDILDQVARFDTPYVTVTGGEPLAQPACTGLLQRLCDAGYRVSLETSGAIDLDGIDPRVVIVMDIKAPGSGEDRRNLWQNIERLGAGDQIKFVLLDRSDYEWAREQIRARALADRCELLMSPVHGKLEARELAEWILADRLPVRLQLQLHKLLWGDVAGR